MTDTKSLFMSKTFWGVIFTFGAPLFAHFGLSLSDPTLDFLAGTAASGMAAIFAVYGRVAADTKIG